MASKHFDANATNRVILCSDGVANVDTHQEAERLFSHDLTASLQVIARDVNPSIVRSYCLLGSLVTRATQLSTTRLRKSRQASCVTIL